MKKNQSQKSEEKISREDFSESVYLHDHMGGGEPLIITCPHCKKDIEVELRTVAGDEDCMQIYWGKDGGKDGEDIEEKREKYRKQK